VWNGVLSALSRTTKPSNTAMQDTQPPPCGTSTNSAVRRSEQYAIMWRESTLSSPPRTRSVSNTKRPSASHGATASASAASAPAAPASAAPAPAEAAEAEVA
jgi:hypothetical protein